MGTLTRPPKPSAGGGTAYVDGTLIEPSEVNADFDTVYNEFNGNIEDVNVDVAADVALTKIADLSGTVAEAGTVTDPGPSGAQSLAVDLSEELERIRFVLQRLALGTGGTVSRVDGTGPVTAYWGDGPGHGKNILWNSDFAAVDNGSAVAPDGWVQIQAGAAGTITNGLFTIGEGPTTRHLANPLGNKSDGIEQTLTPRIARKYLIVLRWNPTDASLITSGADVGSEFRDVNITSVAGALETITAIVQSDVVGSDIDVRITGDYLVNSCQVFEVPDGHRDNPLPWMRDLNTTATTALTTSMADMFQTDVFRGSVGNVRLRIGATLTFTSTQDGHEVYAQIRVGGTVIAGPVAQQVDNARGTTIHLEGLTAVAQADFTNLDVDVQAKADAAGFVTLNGTEAAETLQSTLIIEMMPGG